ncbi:hypothetical protein FH972_020067 [Carpinus fangiana]|uniref:VQ domain-containing protein n=1 Tax=Carpinus fangiana TaxID=176857 RepID=A0A5N6RWJ0_9ROSI|nr:hypothetical protein FH972_020067 [Carpinus fangiana]
MSSQTREQMQGPGPAHLRVSQGSRKITNKPPVIIYLQPPKVVHVRPEEFRATVQRLTGNQAPSSSTTPTSVAEETVAAAAEETMGGAMGIVSSECQQQSWSAGSAFGMPDDDPMLSNFAAHPAFY